MNGQRLALLGFERLPDRAIWVGHGRFEGLTITKLDLAEHPETVKSMVVSALCSGGGPFVSYVQDRAELDQGVES